MVFFFIFLVFLVLFLAWSYYEFKDGFFFIIWFGSVFEYWQFLEVRVIVFFVNFEFGYDGQFYV